MKNLNKYVKSPKINSSLFCIQTSISISKVQKQFINENNLNLSKMVRDMLREIMGQKEENLL